MSLAAFAARLRGLRGGATDQRAGARAAQELQREVSTALGAHVDTGLALRTARVTGDRDGVRLTLQDYTRYLEDFPFRDGLPPKAVERVAELRAEELRRALGGS